MAQLASINLNLLLALDALLAEANVTRAAKRLGLSQSAMSHNLARLRELLDDPLLIRGSQGMQRTPRAEALAFPLRDALHQLQRALDPPQFTPEHCSDTFVVATADVLAAEYTHVWVAELARLAPKATLSVRSLAGRLTDALDDSEVHLVLGPKFTDSGALVGRSVAREPMLCAVRAGHPEVGEALSLEQFIALEHVLVSPTGKGGSRVDEALAALGLARRIGCRVALFTVAPHVVRGTDMVWTGPASGLRHLGADLVVFEPPLDLPPLSIWATWSRRLQHDPAQRWFRDLILDGDAALTRG